MTILLSGYVDPVPPVCHATRTGVVFSSLTWRNAGRCRQQHCVYQLEHHAVSYRER